MSLFRSLPIKERYKVWKLYKDAYPEMSHRDMIQHFDGGGTVENNQNKLTPGSEYKPHNTILGQSPDKYGYLLPETNIFSQDLSNDIYPHFVKNKPVIDNAIKKHYTKKWEADSSNYPNDFQDLNYQKKDYIAEKNEWRYNNFSHAYTAKTYADEHPFKAPFVILGKELKDLYQGATQGKLWEKIYDSPVDVRNDLIGLKASYLGKSNEEFLKELPDKLYIENKRDKPSVTTAKGKDFINNLINPLKLKNEYQDGGFIEDDAGQWNGPGKYIINSPNITMKGVDYPVYGRGDNGKEILMQPGRDYNFGNAKKVYEIPMMQKGGQLYDDTTRPDNWLSAEQPLYLQKIEDLGKDTYGNYILPDVDIFPTKEQYTKIPNPVAGKVQKIDPDYNSPIEFGAMTVGAGMSGVAKPLLNAINFYNPIPINTGKVAEKTGYYAVRAADNIVSSIPGGKKATKEIVERLMRQRASAERNFSDVKSAIKDYIKKRPINGEYSGVYTDNLLYEYPEIYENAEMPDLINLFLKGDETGLRKLDPKELKLDLIPIDEKYFKRYKGLENRVYEMPTRKIRQFPDKYQGSHFVNESNRVVGFEESAYDNLFDVGGHNRYLKLNDDGSATKYYQDLYKYHPDDLFTKHLNNKNPFIAGMLKGGIRAVEKRGKPFFLVGKREYTEPYVTKSLDEYEKYLNTLKVK